MKHVVFLLGFVLTIAAIADAEDIAPGKGIVLDIARNWRPGHWPSGLPFPQESDFEFTGATTTFTIVDPNCRDNWLYDFDNAVDARVFPLCTMKYKAQNIDTANALYCFWIDDTTGPANMHGMRPFMTNQIIADGQIHELKSDLRKFKPVGISERMALAVKTGKEGNARFELLELRFELPPEEKPHEIKDAEPMQVKVALDGAKFIEGATVTSNADWLNYRRQTKTDTKGISTVTAIATDARRHVLRIEAAGMYPADVFPSLTSTGPVEVSMHKSVTYSGMVTDELGQAISGATISLQIPEQWNQQPSFRVRHEMTMSSDSQGKWNSPAFPDLSDRPAILYQHPDYASDVTYAAPSSPDKLLAGSEIHVMKKGVAITGVVLDSKGNPVPDAKVMRGYNEGGPRSNIQKTDANGNFAFLPAKTGKVLLTIQSSKTGPELMEIDVTDNFKPLEIKLPTALKLGGKITDENDKPLAGAYIGVSTWRGQQTLDWWTVTGATGEFNWYAAPSDEIEVWIDKNGYGHQNQKMKAPGRYTIKLSPNRAP